MADFSRGEIADMYLRQARDHFDAGAFQAASVAAQISVAAGTAALAHGDGFLE